MLFRAMGSDEWHDAKGLKLQKNDCNDVFLLGQVLQSISTKLF